MSLPSPPALETQPPAPSAAILPMPPAAGVDRRRPGRLPIENSNLIELLRAPNPASSVPEDFTDTPSLAERTGFLPILLAAAFFWAVALRLFNLI